MWIPSHDGEQADLLKSYDSGGDALERNLGLRTDSPHPRPALSFTVRVVGKAKQYILQGSRDLKSVDALDPFMGLHLMPSSQGYPASGDALAGRSSMERDAPNWEDRLKICGCQGTRAVLDDESRVLSERGMSRALGIKRGGAHWRRRKGMEGAQLPVYLSAPNLKPYISNDLEGMLLHPIVYKTLRGGATGNGILGRVYPAICRLLVIFILPDFQRALGDSSMSASRSGRADSALWILRCYDWASGFHALIPLNPLG